MYTDICGSLDLTKTSSRIMYEDLFSLEINPRRIKIDIDASDLMATKSLSPITGFDAFYLLKLVMGLFYLSLFHIKRLIMKMKMRFLFLLWIKRILSTS